jgi:starch-binding outer membrane protein, SusD/RagB family
MKKIKYIMFWSAILLGLNACFDDYLTVNPKTDITTDLLFSSEAGYKDALSGVYIQMKQPALYGSNLSMSAIEHLISNYNTTFNSTAQYINQWRYDEQQVENLFGNIFASKYKVIAAANAILDRIDKDVDVFYTEGLAEMIKGEALAIRAYCHLDVLRLFGPVPVSIADEVMLPYADHLSRDPFNRLSFAAFRQALLDDLQLAEQLLYEVDPIRTYSIEAVSRPGYLDFDPADNFMAYRSIRMNYYAVKALQARAYLWFGNNAEAHEAASVVIEAVNKDNSSKFELASASALVAGNYVMTNEHIFALHEFALPDIYSNSYGRGELYRGTDESLVKSELYGNTGTDIREANLWEIVLWSHTGPRYVIKKYKVEDEGENFLVDFRRIPLLRLSEMYLISMETAPIDEAQAYWNAFATSRNLVMTTLPADIEERKSILIKEYRKEFYAEGQAFYAYKRVNAGKSAILWAPASAELNYVVPMPLTEVVQHN